jgi:hypothetical protein
VNPSPLTVPDGIAPIEAFRVWTFEFEGAVGRLHPRRGWSAGRTELLVVAEIAFTPRSCNYLI